MHKVPLKTKSIPVLFLIILLVCLMLFVGCDNSKNDSPAATPADSGNAGQAEATPDGGIDSKATVNMDNAKPYIQEGTDDVPELPEFFINYLRQIDDAEKVYVYEYSYLVYYDDTPVILPYIYCTVKLDGDECGYIISLDDSLIYTDRFGSEISDEYTAAILNDLNIDGIWDKNVYINNLAIDRYDFYRVDEKKFADIDKNSYPVTLDLYILDSANFDIEKYDFKPLFEKYIINYIDITIVNSDAVNSEDFYPCYFSKAYYNVVKNELSGNVEVVFSESDFLTADEFIFEYNADFVALEATVRDVDVKIDEAELITSVLHDYDHGKLIEVTLTRTSASTDTTEKNGMKYWPAAPLYFGVYAPAEYDGREVVATDGEIIDQIMMMNDYSFTIYSEYHEEEDFGESGKYETSFYIFWKANN